MLLCQAEKIKSLKLKMLLVLLVISLKFHCLIDLEKGEVNGAYKKSAVMLTYFEGESVFSLYNL